MKQQNTTFEIVGHVKFAQVPKWVVRHPNLSVGAKMLYTDIMSYADNETRSAFPSRERLADDLGVTSRTIGSYIKELEDAHIITVERRRNKRTGNFYANHYCLDWSEPAEINDPRREETNDPITIPTVLTTPTSPNATTSRSSDDNPTPASYEDAGRKITAQTGISQETKNQLVDEAVRLYLTGNHEYDWDEWDTFAERITECTGYFVDDLIANRRFASRLAELIETHADKGLRYGASAWLGVLLNHPDAA